MLIKVILDNMSRFIKKTYLSHIGKLNEPVISVLISILIMNQKKKFNFIECVEDVM